MKFSNRYGRYLIVLAVVISGATVFGAGLGAQDEGWRIVRAEYGYRNQRRDVTDLVGDLISSGGVNGRVAVNNQTMGGDPAIGKEKQLHILARNRRSEEREFNLKEGGFIDVRMFAVRRDDWDDRPANYGGRDQDDSRGLRIMRAYYGVQGRTVNVTDLLRSRARDGVLTLVVTNNALGGDPAIGADKVLIVLYRYEGRESATAVREGNTLTIP
jgi:hypothetical protein